MRGGLSGLVPKGSKQPNHNWLPTERMIPGAVLKLHACATCKPAHVRAYDMQVSSADRFLGASEYEARSQHN